MRKGQTYGTIICDLETGAVIDLLADREATTVANWLQQHPGVEIISRDRGGAYAEGARLGAPTARQVADRFHLLCNLGQALEELLTRLYPVLSQISAEPAAPEMAVAPSTPLESQFDQQMAPAETPALATPVAEAAVPDPSPTTRTTAARRNLRQRDIDLSSARRRTRLARYEEVVRLAGLGWTQTAIADQLSLSRKTIGRWLSKGHFPEYQQPPARRRKLDAYTQYLQRRWTEGCHNARQLLDELRAQGYAGGCTTLREYLAGWREKTPNATPPAAQRERGRRKTSQRMRPRQLKWLLLQSIEEWSDEEYALVRKICQHSEELRVAYGLTRDFQGLVRRRKAEQLAAWVERALGTGVEELAGFARSVLRDFAAVYAGLEVEWSQGRVEGQVNRLKMLKRQMFGRAKFDLLRIRVLYAH